MISQYLKRSLFIFVEVVVVVDDDDGNDDGKTTYTNIIIY